MILLLLIAGAMVVWAWRSGELKALRSGDIVAILAVLAAVAMLMHGGQALPVIAIAGAGGWYWHRRRSRPMRPKAAMTVDEAQRVLNLSADAGPDQIRAAHRAMVSRVHPDSGGSADLAARVNLARDILIADLQRRRSNAL